MALPCRESENKKQCPEESFKLDRIWHAEGTGLTSIGHRKEPDPLKKPILKRKRVKYSCTECSRRKRKCSRTAPCQQCVERHISYCCDLAEGDVQEKDVQAASLQKSAPDSIQTEQHQHRRQVVPQESRPPQPSQQAMQGSSIYKSISTDNIPSEKFIGYLETLTGTQETTTLTDPVRSIRGAADVDLLMYDYGAPDSTVQALMSVFPDRQLADALVDHFFHDINWLQQPISQKIFRHYYNRFWVFRLTLKADDINTYALLVITMAISMWSFDRTDMAVVEPALVQKAARGLFFAGRRALLVSTTLGRYNMQHVLAYNMASRFLLLDHRYTEAWICAGDAIKTAQWIGMHRDGSRLQLPSWEYESRRRIWSAVYCMDRRLSLSLCRPSQIEDSLVDTKLPSKDDERGLFSEIFTSTFDGAAVVPTPLTYARLRHCLSTIMGKISRMYQSLVKSFQVNEITEIEQALQIFKEKQLPPYFQSSVDTLTGQVHHIDTSRDESCPFVMIHRYLIQMDTENTLMSLHRPLFLRAGSHTSTSYRYAINRQACVSAAHRCLLLQQDIVRRLEARFYGQTIPTAYHLHLGIYDNLNALIIIGIHLLTLPPGRSLKENSESALHDLLKQHLDIYTQSTSPYHYHLREEVRLREAHILDSMVKRIEEQHHKRTSDQFSEERLCTAPIQVATSQAIDTPQDMKHTERILDENTGILADAELVLNRYLPDDMTWPRSLSAFQYPDAPTRSQNKEVQGLYDHRYDEDNDDSMFISQQIFDSWFPNEFMDQDHDASAAGAAWLGTNASSRSNSY